MKVKEINSINTAQIEVIESSIDLFNSLLILERKYHIRSEALCDKYSVLFLDYDQWHYNEYEKEYDENFFSTAEQDSSHDFLNDLDEKSYNEDVDYNYMDYENWRSFKIRMSQDLYDNLQDYSNEEENELSEKENELSEEELKRQNEIWQRNNNLLEQLESFNDPILHKEFEWFNGEEFIGEYNSKEKYFAKNKELMKEFNELKEKIDNEYIDEIKNLITYTKKRIYSETKNCINLPVDLANVNKTIANNPNSNCKLPKKSNIAENVLMKTEGILNKMFAYTSKEGDNRFFSDNETRESIIEEILPKNDDEVDY